MGKRESRPRQLVKQIFALLPLGVSTRIGERERAANTDAPPAILAILRGAPTIGQPNKAGDQMYPKEGRALLNRYFEIRWECHAVGNDGVTDDAAAEDLYTDLLVAIRNLCHHSVEFSDEEWIDQQDGQDGYERFGSVIAITSTIAMPVYEPRGAGGIRTLTATPPIVTTATLNDHEET